jgi:hypothetical protein
MLQETRKRENGNLRRRMRQKIEEVINPTPNNLS